MGGGNYILDVYMRCTDGIRMRGAALLLFLPVLFFAGCRDHPSESLLLNLDTQEVMFNLTAERVERQRKARKAEKDLEIWALNQRNEQRNSHSL